VTTPRGAAGRRCRCRERREGFRCASDARLERFPGDSERRHHTPEDQMEVTTPCGEAGRRCRCRERLEGLCASHAGTGPPRDSFPRVHAARELVRVHAASRASCRRTGSGSRAPDDPVARKQPLAEPLHHVSRTHASNALLKSSALLKKIELEIRFASRRVRPFIERRPSSSC